MTSSQPAPTRTLPDRANLGHLRKQAKELLSLYKSGQPDAVAEVEQFENRPQPESFALNDAQRVLARAYGFASWTTLKQHVEGLTIEAFIDATNAGDVEAVRRIAKARPGLVDVEHGRNGGTALHDAVINRDVEMTQLLLELGSDARRGIWPYRDVMTAHTIAKDREYHEIVTVITSEEKRRRTELNSSGTTDHEKIELIQKTILDRRTDEALRILECDPSLVDACNVRGATTLHISAWAHLPQLATWLLDRNATVHATDAEGKTPLDYAATSAGWSANDDFHYLLDNARVEPESFDETVRLLRSAGAELTPRAAVAIGDLNAVQRMHSEGCLVNDVGMGRGGLLSIAVRANRIEMVSLLLDLGLDPTEPTVPTEDGQVSYGQPLWFAALCGRHRIAELLLEHGADVNAIKIGCGDAIGNAYTTGDEQMKGLLRKRGARVTASVVGLHRETETARAILNGAIEAECMNAKTTKDNLVEELLWAGACGGDPEIIRMCLPRIQRSLEDPWWASILGQPRRIWNHQALHTNEELDRATYAGCMRLILEHGVHPDVGFDGDATELHSIAGPGETQMTNEERIRFAILLLDFGASLTLRDSLMQSTPLGWACRWGRVDLVRLLLERGADSLEADAPRWATPMAWARKGQHDEIIRLLDTR